MAKVIDVAAYILSKQSSMSAMKLQKLVYYSQAWNLVWDERPLFDEPIQAWANGPVVYELFTCHRGLFTVHPETLKGGNPAALDVYEAETVNVVLSSYGKMSGRDLSALTHDELPWREAREGLSATDRTNRAISLETMVEFYSGMEYDEEDSVPVSSFTTSQ